MSQQLPGEQERKHCNPRVIDFDEVAEDGLSPPSATPNVGAAVAVDTATYSSATTAEKFLQELHDDEHQTPIGTTTATAAAEQTKDKPPMHVLDAICNVLVSYRTHRSDVSYFVDYNRAFGGKLVSVDEKAPNTIAFVPDVFLPNALPISFTNVIPQVKQIKRYRTKVSLCGFGYDAFGDDYQATASTDLPSQAIVGYFRIGFLCDGVNKLYAWTGTEFEDLHMENPKHVALQSLAHRVLSYNMMMQGWFVAPCFNLIPPIADSTLARDVSGQQMLDSLFAHASYASLPIGGAPILSALASKFNALQTLNDFVEFIKAVNTDVRSKSNAALVKQQHSHAYYLAATRPIAKGEAIQSAGPDSRLFWALQTYYCVSNELQDGGGVRKKHPLGTYKEFFARIAQFDAAITVEEVKYAKAQAAEKAATDDATVAEKSISTPISVATASSSS